jgi:acylglycerol lipase
MKTRDWVWEGKDGLKMFAQSWEPEMDPKAVVCLVHGLGEHSGRYAHVGRAFSEARFALAGFDLRGHGRSGGQRGHFPSFEALMDDIHRFIQDTSERFPGLPVFLYGHSLGGFLILNYATYHKHTLKGVIATGAGLRSPVLEQKVKITLSKVMGGLLPTVTIPTGLDVDSLSRNPEVVRAYKEDPLVHDKATLSAARVSIEAVDHAFAHAAEFPTPLLMMHGAADRVTYPHGSQEFADLVPKNCTLKIWDGLYHEIHNEPEQVEVFKFMIDWMDAQVAG